MEEFLEDVRNGDGGEDARKAILRGIVERRKEHTRVFGHLNGGPDELLELYVAFGILGVECKASHVRFHSQVAS